MRVQQMRVERHGFIAVNVTEQVIRLPRFCLPLHPIRAGSHRWRGRQMGRRNAKNNSSPISSPEWKQFAPRAPAGSLHDVLDCRIIGEPDMLLHLCWWVMR